MNPRWTVPGSVLDAAARLVAAPRAEVLDRLADEIVDLVPHRALALRTADCARSPVKTSGDRSVADRITAAELRALADRAGGAPGVQTAELGGEARTVVTVDARPVNGRGALLVVVPSETEPDAEALDLLGGLWSLVAAAEAARADETGPGLLTGNQAAAGTRRHVADDLRRTHATTLLSLLGVLRSERRDDATTRATATGIAADALLELRRARDDDRSLSAQPAREAFQALADRLDVLCRHVSADVELVGPTADAELPQDVATAARASTETLVHDALTRSGTSRIRIAWELAAADLSITVRDDGAVDPSAETVEADDRVVALGGHRRTTAVPGWGTTAELTVPLHTAEPAPPGPLEGLHPRELEVLTELTHGLRNREIARKLNLSEHTVKFHVRNVLEKLDVSSRGEAAARARQLAAPR